MNGIHSGATPDYSVIPSAVKFKWSERHSPASRNFRPKSDNLSNMDLPNEVHDTMNDLIVDTIGAVVVAAMGWAYMKSGRYSFIADAVRGFVRRNPRLFLRRQESREDRR
jgi:hypothetical protein